MAKLAIARDAESLDVIPVEFLSYSSIQGEESAVIQKTDTWMTPIINYLEHETLPNDKNEARKLLRQVARFLLIDGILYRHGHFMPLL